jgi:hypothetical protein
VVNLTLKVEEIPSDHQMATGVFYKNKTWVVAQTATRQLAENFVLSLKGTSTKCDPNHPMFEAVRTHKTNADGSITATSILSNCNPIARVQVMTKKTVTRWK